jgi:hypothetical protein
MIFDGELGRPVCDVAGDDHFLRLVFRDQHDLRALPHHPAEPETRRKDPAGACAGHRLVANCLRSAQLERQKLGFKWVDDCHVVILEEKDMAWTGAVLVWPNRDIGECDGGWHEKKEQAECGKTSKHIYSSFNDLGHAELNPCNEGP